jgi:uncharacterized protein YdaU (DUF1376 family)
VNYYSFHIGDYISNTVHLTPLEDLAYRRLLDLYYQTEAPITTDMKALARRIRLDHDVIESVLSEFFELTEYGHENSRCNKELARIAKVSAKRSEAAKCRWNANAQQKQSKCNASGMHTQDPLPKTQDPLPKKNTRVKYDPQFDGLWKIYGLKGNKKPAYAEWQKLDDQDKDDAAKAVPDYLLETPERTLRKDMERYFSNRTWEGVLERKAAGTLNIPNDPSKWYEDIKA